MLNQVEKLKNTQFHEDLMLILLDNDCGTLTTTVVNQEGHGQSWGFLSFHNISNFSPRIPITAIVNIITVMNLIKEIIFRRLIKVIIFRDLIKIFIYSAPN